MMILALDLGKFNTVCCFYDTRTRKHRFETIATTRFHVESLLSRKKIDLVVMEACRPSEWIRTSTTERCAAAAAGYGRAD